MKETIQQLSNPNGSLNISHSQYAWKWFINVKIFCITTDLSINIVFLWFFSFLHLPYNSIIMYIVMHKVADVTIPTIYL